MNAKDPTGMPPIPMPDTNTTTDATAGVPPVPMPPTGDAAVKAAGRPKWLLPVVAGACALLLAAGGYTGHTLWSAHELAVAKSACAETADAARIAANQYHALLDGKAADMAKVKTKDVKDPATITTLAGMLKTETPAYEGCVADTKPGLDQTAAKLDQQADWYKKHTKGLARAVDAVAASRLDKTIDDASALYKSSDGKVADAKTRDQLAQAIKAKDQDAIDKATQAVNASIKTKTDADAKTQQEAQQAAQAAQAAQAGATGGQTYANTNYTGGGYTGGGYANTGYTGGGYSHTGGGYTNGGYNGGGYTAPSTPAAPSTTGNNGSSNSGSSGWDGSGCTTSNSNPSCDSGWIQW